LVIELFFLNQVLGDSEIAKHACERGKHGRDCEDASLLRREQARDGPLFPRVAGADLQRCPPSNTRASCELSSQFFPPRRAATWC
jgi:hypothetical protein